MTALEVVLLVVGMICVAASFLLGEREGKSSSEKVIASELTEQQKEQIRKQIDDVVEEQLQNVSERTEAKLDKISNTKMLEMNDYAETIIGEINRNHNETVFLYDMLNEKAKEVKSTVKDVNIAKNEVKKIHAEAENNVITPRSAENRQEEAGEDQEATSRDLAKERLMELVRQSNERSRASEGTMVRNTQAEKLNNMVADQAAGEQPEMPEEKSETKETAEAQSGEKQPETANTQSGEKQPETERPAAKKTPAKRTTKKKGKSVGTKPAAAPEPVEKSTNNNEKILSLYNQGMSNKDIAKELNLGIGEVKLVIDLFNSAK